MKQPTYDLKEFIKCCSSNREMVFIFPSALKDAKNDFELDNQGEILDFIGNNRLEMPEFRNRKLWEKNRDPNNPLFVEDYEFKSLGKLGYIAFMYNKKENKWLIKSFHLSDRMNTLLADELKKALDKKGKQNEQ